MRIAFNILDEITGSYIQFVRRQIDRPDLDDEKVISKHLKRYIGDTVNSWNFASASLNETIAAETSRSLFQTINSGMMEAERQLEEKLREVRTTFTPIVVDDEV